MSKVIKVVGVDPSMSNFGLAIGTLDLDTDKLEIHGLELVETKAGGTKKNVRVNSDDLRRAKELSHKNLVKMKCLVIPIYLACPD